MDGFVVFLQQREGGGVGLGEVFDAEGQGYGMGGHGRFFFRVSWRRRWDYGDEDYPFDTKVVPSETILPMGHKQDKELLFKLAKSMLKPVMQTLPTRAPEAEPPKPGMERDAQLGYGFLFAGAGLPYLIDKLFIPVWGIIVSLVCVVIGGSFLVHARFKGRRVIDWKNKTYGQKLLFAGLSVFVIGSIGWGIVTASIRIAKPEHGLTKEDLQEVLKGSKESRIVITKTEGVIDKSEKTHRKELFLNINYQDGGDAPATGIEHGAKTFDTNIPPPAEHVLAKQDEVLKRLVSSGVTDAGEMEPASSGDSGAFFSVPQPDDPVAEIFARALDSDPHNTRIYLIVAFRYRDAALPINKMRVTEYCGFFWDGSEHMCGRRRNFVIDWPAPKQP